MLAIQGGLLKLAEALNIRADLQRRSHQLKERILRNAKIQVDEKPAEDPNELLAELEHVNTELVGLVKSINRTNCKIIFGDNQMLSDILSERDYLSKKIELYRELAKQATVTQDRYKKLEIKFKPSVDVRAIQLEADKLSKQFRELDMKIQSINWTEDLI